MATLSLIAEPFPDWEARVHFAAAEDLANALAATAPRSCSARFLSARGTVPPEFNSPRISAEHLPMGANALPILWQSSTTARPLDGEMTHSVTPMIPLRSRAEDDGTQTTVTVPNGLAWEAPDLLTPAQARLTRSFVKRAARYADVLITTSHSTASLLQEHYGHDLPVQVIPPVAPSAFLAAADSESRRERLGLPERYLVTTANLDDHGRLQWVLDAYESDPSLPHLVVVSGLDPVQHVKGAPQPGDVVSKLPASIRDRVTVVPGEDLSDVGAILSGAAMLLQPQSFAGTGYTIAAALMAGVPVLHAGSTAFDEQVLDAGIAEPEAPGFITALSRLFIASAGDGTSELERLTVHAADRGRSYSWNSVAWQLWETHALI
ncbi:mannosyltransferase [Leucobacter aridicollis]|uniref:mannosyltransferase n=1 Tax=Leucobacter aridicollis TaxID=283878 RepID=UPI002102EEE8|nr:mannosyltransferase [Leucobacter aridicollis]UTX52802.1 mannosyltransferase [Leucobacter aridicollis]